MFLIRFSLRNPLITNLLLILIAIIGVLSWQSMPQEMFPVVKLDKIRIATVFEGAAPEEVEKQITIPIEQEFDGLADIDVMTSTSSEGLSNILIEFKPGTDIDNFIREASDTIDRITGLPEEAEKSSITRIQTRFPVISVAISGAITRGELQRVADDVKHRLLALPGVAGTGMAGNREWELWVEVDPEEIAARKITVNHVIDALKSNLRDGPGGVIHAREGDILLRGTGQEVSPEAITRLPLLANQTGGIVRLGDVAHVTRRLEEARTLARFNGRPSINMIVTKTAKASTIAVSDEVRALIDKLPRTLPPTVHARAYSDLSNYVRTRLNTVKSSGFVGLFLVLLSLYLFLNFRIALITALGIPVSFLFASIMLHQTGYTINMVSLFAFLIVLGMIVDDAIIVTENIYRHMENGLSRTEAAKRGAEEVFWPVVASTLTTIAAFLPMFAVGGTMGAFIAVIPVVVSFALLGSLLEAFIILPSHAYEYLHPEHRPRKRRSWIDWPGLLKRYTSLMRQLLQHRYIVSTLTVCGLAIVITFAATRLPFELFGSFDTGQFYINVDAPNTYKLKDSRDLAIDIEQAIRSEIGQQELDSLLTNIGVTFIDFNTIRFESNTMQFIVDLTKRRPQGFIERWVTPVISMNFEKAGVRERSTAEVIDSIRNRLDEIPGIRRFSILKPRGGPAGPDVEVAVSGPEVNRLRELGDQVVQYLGTLSGVRDVRQDLEPGKIEFHYTLNERGKLLGLTQASLSTAVRIGFQGIEATQVNFGERLIPVRVLFPESWREDAAALSRLRLVLPGGRVVYLSDVANIESSRGASVVKRRGMLRLATITAEVDSNELTPNDVVRQLREHFTPILNTQPGYDLLFLGQKREAQQSVNDLIRAMFIALALIFFILAALFKSLLEPLVVMFAIPFGIIGIIFGHTLMGLHLQFLSLIGFLALSGIIVNDSLILVDFSNKLRASGWDRIEAMVEACRVRIRPILLTSITTFLGISPMIFFSTGQTAFLAPMAVSLGFGLLFATVLILVAVPCFTLIADDLRNVLRSATGRLPPAAQPAGVNDGEVSR